MIERLYTHINNSLIGPSSFYKVNKGLTNFTTYQIAISVPPDVKKVFDINFDIEAVLLNQIKQELNRCVYKHINNSLRKTTKIEHVDLRQYENKPFGHTIDGLQMYDRVFSYIGGYGYKNTFTSSKISSEMQDNIQFILSAPPTNFIPNYSLPYLVGKIGNTSVWVDQYLKYDDDKIVMFDEIEVNFDVKNISSIDDDPTFSPKIAKIVIELNLCVGNVDSMIMSIIESMSSPSYAEYISTRRSTKIDEIIK